MARRAAHLPLRGFIGDDRPGEPEQMKVDGLLLVANRWARAAELPAWAQEQGLACDERTALLVDVDKTFIGARGLSPFQTFEYKPKILVPVRASFWFSSELKSLAVDAS